MRAATLALNGSHRPSEREPHHYHCSRQKLSPHDKRQEAGARQQKATGPSTTKQLVKETLKGWGEPSKLPHPLLCSQNSGATQKLSPTWALTTMLPVLLALVMELSLPGGAQYPFVPFMAAVVGSSWIGGRAGGLVTTLLSTCLVWYVFIPEPMSFRLYSIQALWSLFLFAITGLGVSLSHDWMRQSATSANQALERRDAELGEKLAQSIDAQLVSGARLAGIVDSAMDAIISIDSEQRILLFNTAAESLFRCSAAEVVGSGLERFLPAAARSAHKSYVQSFGKTGVTSRSMRSLGTLTAVRADGEEFPIEASISQVEVGGQKVFTVILRDISERLRAEAEILERENRLKAVIESLAEGVVISTLEGRLIHWNKAAREMHEIAADEDLERHMEEFQNFFRLETLNGEVLPFEKWPMNRVLAGESLRDQQLRVSRLDRDWCRVISYGGDLIDEGNGPRTALLSLTDISSEKRAQDELSQLNQELERRVVERTGQLEQANKELEAFSYSVSHDLRAPLRAVDGYSRALIEDYGDALPDEGKRYLGTIRAGAQRMGCLIDDLLAFSRLNRSALSKEQVHADRLVRLSLEELSSQMEGRDIEVKVDDLPTCWGDPALLSQVWVNLLSNAIKYTRLRDKALIEIEGRCEGSESVYSVRDNGTGFDMRYVEKLFGVFQRLHRVEEFEGTGVGLAIVERIVRRHGGKVWAQGVPDQGACFFFAIPKAKGEGV